MIPMRNLDLLPKQELDDLLSPIFCYALDESPVAEREALIDRICDLLLDEMGSHRVAPPTDQSAAA